MSRPNGINTNYTYDSLSRLLSVLHQAGGSTIDGASYTVDATGNRTSKTDQLAGVTSNYSYDAIYELTQVTQAASQTESYTYDPVGNRLSSLAASTSSYNASNELTSNSNATYTYDNNGNTLTSVTGSNTTTYAWDFENRLTSVTLPGTGGTVSFKYDPLGRRIEKVSPTFTSIFAYDGDNLTETTNSSGAVVARYAQTQNIDEPLAELRSSTTSYYEADGLGSITSLTGSNGTLAQSYTYDSFANTTASTGTLSNPFRYTAREFDNETGLYFFRARYFDPQVGRFISEDPIGFSGDINVYRYSFNSPVNLDDPSGLAPGLPGFCRKNYEDCAKKAFGRTQGNVPGSDRSIPGYEAALDVFQASLFVGADAPTVAITMAFESNSNLYPATNLNSNGSIDIGPMQLNTDTINNGGFHLFPGSLTDAQGYFPAPNAAFNGDPFANTMTGALYLRSLGSHPERYAAPQYRPSRSRSLKKLDGAFRKFFDCLKSASMPQ
ncbi:MAG: RHS repeat-associated core domain-containing protein [Candidatus Acidiferrales bacterium]